MLGNASVAAILPAADMARAKTFYTDTLGLTLVNESPGGVVMSAGNGTQLFIYPYGDTKAEHTVAGFQVTDVDAEVRDLRAKGVAFENYDMPGLKTVDGIADVGGMKGAWFKDSEGNIIGVAQMTG